MLFIARLVSIRSRLLILLLGTIIITISSFERDLSPSDAREVGNIDGTFNEMIMLGKNNQFPYFRAKRGEQKYPYSGVQLIQKRD